jgi:3-oxoacyl-[acyl-carrier-protein] synthase-3
MALLSIEGVNVAGISAVVPATVEYNKDLPQLSEQEKLNLIKATGIESRRIANAGITAADLCAKATQKLLTELKWKAAEVDLLVFVSQTPDYSIPASSMFIQHQLGLSNRCICIDINQGCAGYVYGLSVMSSMMQSGQLKKGLLLVGDTLSKLIAENDLSLLPVFSDAGSCTALEYNEAGNMKFNLQSDGSGYDHIIVKNGGARNPMDDDCYLYMNGQDVFNFALKEVVPNAEALISAYRIDLNSMDYFIMHQANILLNESIRKKLKIPGEKTFYSLKDYGNTSSATIPVSIAANAHKIEDNKTLHFLFTGFGVGLSWGAAWIQMKDTKFLPIDEY